MTITIYRSNGWLFIEDSDGNRMRYLYFTKREALRRFKEEFGHRYKRVTIDDWTRRDNERH